MAARKGFRLFVLCGMLAVAGSPHAAELPASPQGGPVLTRLVRLFGDLETQLAAAVAKGDQAAIDDRLAEDFEMRVGAQPGEPVPRAQWLAAMRAKPPVEPSISQMAVHGYGELAVVSFQQTQKFGAKSIRLFIVDVWQSRNGHWILSTRYADVSDPKHFPPGMPPPQPKIEKRY